jgi:hypothetical protein
MHTRVHGCRVLRAPHSAAPCVDKCVVGFGKFSSGGFLAFKVSAITFLVSGLEGNCPYTGLLFIYQDDSLCFHNPRAAALSVCVCDK